MKIKKVGILTADQLFSLDALAAIKESGTKCYCSDLARLTGVSYNQNDGNGDYWFEGEFTSTKKINQLLLI